MSNKPSLTKALPLSIMLHTVLLGGLLLGTIFDSHKEKPKQQIASNKPIVKASVVNASDVQKQVDKLKQNKRNQLAEEKARQAKLAKEQRRIKELERQRKKKQAEKVAADKAAKRAKEKAATEKRIADKAIKKAKDTQKLESDKAKKAAAERVKQEKAAAVATAKRVKQEKAVAEAEAKRLADQKSAKLKADKLRKEKLKREQDAKERAAQEAMIAEQMAAEQSQVNQARQRKILSEIEKYTLLISAAIQRHWNTDESMQGKQCVLNIKLAPSGTVFSVKPISGDKFVCKSAQDAVYKANTLPISKDPEVYAKLKEINLTVQPEFN